MANPSYTYTLTNGTTADATQVMQNFNDILNGVTDGTKDLSLAALTVAGTASFNGNVNLGNASGDDLTFTGSLASSIPIKTNNSFDLGSSTLGLRKLYLGNGGVGATCSVVADSHATTREYTIPDCGAAATFIMSQLAQTIAGVKTFSSAPVFSAGCTAGNTTTSTFGRIVGGYASEISNQIFNSIQQNCNGSGGSIGLTVTGAGWGLALVTCANTGEQALVLFSSTDTKIVSQNGTGWLVGSSGATHRFDYTNASNLIQITKVTAGAVTYDISLLINAK